MVGSFAFNLGTSATLITPLSDIATAWGAVIANLGALTIYLGGPGVTTTVGTPVAAGASVTLYPATGPLYAVATVAQVAPANTRVLVF